MRTGQKMNVKRVLWLILAIVMIVSASQMVFADKQDGDIVRQFVVDTPYTIDYLNESAETQREFAPNTIMTNGVADPLFSKGGYLFMPTTKDKIKFYVIAVDFNDCRGDVMMPFGAQVNVLTDRGSVYNLSDPEVYFTTIFRGTDGLKALEERTDGEKFQWKGTDADQYRGIAQLLEERSMGQMKVEAECLNRRATEDPDNSPWEWIHIDASMLEYAVQGPANVEDYRMNARLHQAAIDAAYATIPDLDIEDIDFICTIVPNNAFGYRDDTNGGAGMDTSFSYNDQALMLRNSEYRLEPGVRTKGGRMVGSGILGIKGIFGYTSSVRPVQSSTSGGVKVLLHELGHGMGLYDDYAYGGPTNNTGEHTNTGGANSTFGGMGGTNSMCGTQIDFPAWRKYRMGWIKDEEIKVVMPGDTANTYKVRALGSYGDDAGKDVATRMIVIPKEIRTRDTFGMFWNNSWNPNKTDYNWYDWYANPWMGGETHAIKTFPTFYVIDCRKPLGADIEMPAASGGTQVGYVANASWETGNGAGGYKIMTGNAGLKPEATFTDPHIGLTVTVISSGDYYDEIKVEYTGVPTTTAKHVYQAELNLSDSYAAPGQEFVVDFDLMTLGAPAPNDVTIPTAGLLNLSTVPVQRVASPLGVKPGIAGYSMEVEFDSTKFDYVSAASSKLGAYLLPDPVDPNKLSISTVSLPGVTPIVVDKDTLISLKMKTKTGVAAGEYAISAKITSVTLLNWRGEEVLKGSVGFDDLGMFGSGETQGTLAALYNTTANNDYVPSIVSRGGKIKVSNAPVYNVVGTVVSDTPGPAFGTFIGVESVVTLYNSENAVIAQVKSDWDGNYTIPGVPTGTGYYVKANKSKYTEAVSAAFAIASADTTVPGMQLKRHNYPVTGTVYGGEKSDGSDATPLAGAKVYTVSMGSGYRVLGGPFITGADGKYELQSQTDSLTNTYTTLAVFHPDYATQLHTKHEGEALKLSMGMMYGNHSYDYIWPANTTRYGNGNSYNFLLNGPVTKNITLTKKQDVHLRINPKSSEAQYQLVNYYTGEPVGGKVNSLGTNNGDDILQNVDPGRYYIEVTRPGYIGLCTSPFGVDATRVFLRNNTTSNTLTLTANNAANTYDVTGTIVDGEYGNPVKGAKVYFVNANGARGVPVMTDAEGKFTIRVLSGANDIYFTASGYVPQKLAVTNGTASDLVTELEPFDGFALDTDAHLVKPGAYFNLMPRFLKAVNSNAAVLEYTYNKDLFDYRGFTPADGVTLLYTEATDSGMKFTVMVSDYNSRTYGSFLFSAKEEADLQNEWHKIELTATYVIKTVDDEKQIHSVTVDTRFSSSKDVDILNPEPGPITLITLSNIIDKFGATSADPLWDSIYAFYDYNNNESIDIHDIAEVAKRVQI